MLKFRTNFLSRKNWRLLSEIILVISLLVSIWFNFFPNKKLSIEEKVILDSNPTILEVVDQSFKKWVGDDEEFLTISLKNTSNRTANNVRIKLFGSDGEWIFSATNTSNIFQKGISLPANKISEFPVAPKSELIEKFSHKCGVCDLTYVGKPKELSDGMLDCFNEPSPPRCNSTSTSIPFIIEISYKNIFGGETKKSVATFANFITGYYK